MWPEMWRRPECAPLPPGPTTGFQTQPKVSPANGSELRFYYANECIWYPSTQCMSTVINMVSHSMCALSQIRFPSLCAHGHFHAIDIRIFVRCTKIIGTWCVSTVHCHKYEPVVPRCEHYKKYASSFLIFTVRNTLFFFEKVRTVTTLLPKSYRVCTGTKCLCRPNYLHCNKFVSGVQFIDLFS